MEQEDSLKKHITNLRYIEVDRRLTSFSCYHSAMIHPLMY